MRKLLLFAGIILVLSCSRETGLNTDTEDLVFLGSYSGKIEVKDTPLGWDEKYKPNLTIILLLYGDNVCEVHAGIMEWPYKTEYDKLELMFRTTEEGLVLYDFATLETVFMVSAINRNTNIDPETDLVNYLGSRLFISWQKSFGKVWDKYSELAAWPKDMALDWDPSDYNDIIQESAVKK